MDVRLFECECTSFVVEHVPLINHQFVAGNRGNQTSLVPIKFKNDVNYHSMVNEIFDCPIFAKNE